MRILVILIVVTCLCSCRQREKIRKSEVGFANLSLSKYAADSLRADFDLLVKSLKEAHTGLYWYSTEKSFDSLVAVQRLQITDSLNEIQFYNIVAPIVAFTKEDHCDISLSTTTRSFLNEKGKYLPIYVLNDSSKMWMLNDDFTGAELLAVNNVPIDSIRRKIYATFASDGFIQSSKIAALDEERFASQYARVIGQADSFSLTVLTGGSREQKVVRVPAVGRKGLTEIAKKFRHQHPVNRPVIKPAGLWWVDARTPVIVYNTFSNRQFRENGMEFRKFTDSCFEVVRKSNATRLVIDVRENGGGSEGNEDYLFAYLGKAPYKKYREVQLSQFGFSFLPYTDYASDEDKKELYDELKKDHTRRSDGVIVRNDGVYDPQPVREDAFRGQVYVLTSGWTYSGGAEFCTLVREHTGAVFIGQETGGGYYGNTSGIVLTLSLPVTKIMVDIPVLKFMLDVKKGRFGRGVIPDYEVKPDITALLEGRDQEIEMVKRLIR